MNVTMSNNKNHILVFCLLLSILLSSMPSYVIQAAPTNVNPAIFRTQEDFKSSNAFKNFPEFQQYIKLSNSMVVPGMHNTRVVGNDCSTMCPQATCVVDKYILISAYDTSGRHHSVIYLLNKETGSYIATLLLPVHSHVGGMAYDGDNIWVSNDANQVSCFKSSDLLKGVINRYHRIKFVNTYKLPLDGSASFMTFYNKQLWVGSYLPNQSGSSNHMYSFYVHNKTKKPTLSKNYTLTLPNRVQGVLFLDKHTMLLSRSQNVNLSTNKNYLSQLNFYGIIYSPRQKRMHLSYNGTFHLPPLCEGITASGDKLYVLFESCAYYYRSGKPYNCQNPIDRLCCFSITDLISNFINN